MVGGEVAWWPVISMGWECLMWKNNRPTNIGEDSLATACAMVNLTARDRRAAMTAYRRGDVQGTPAMAADPQAAAQTRFRNA